MISSIMRVVSFILMVFLFYKYNKVDSSGKYLYSNLIYMCISFLSAIRALIGIKKGEIYVSHVFYKKSKCSKSFWNAVAFYFFISILFAIVLLCRVVQGSP